MLPLREGVRNDVVLGGLFCLLPTLLHPVLSFYVLIEQVEHNRKRKILCQ